MTEELKDESERIKSEKLKVELEDKFKEFFEFLMEKHSEIDSKDLSELLVNMAANLLKIPVFISLECNFFSKFILMINHIIVDIASSFDYLKDNGAVQFAEKSFKDVGRSLN